MSTVAEYYNHTLMAAHRHTLMGVELEAEGYSGRYDEGLDAWNVIEDHSLRNRGVEFVHKVPLRGIQLHDSIDELGRCLSGYSLNISHRCSMHVHIDVRNFTIAELERLYRLYVLFEPALYHIGAKDRYENIYCPGLTHATEQVKQAAQAFSVKSFNNLVDYGCKYTGFNFLPIATQGSVEIRTHAGTLRTEDMHTWVDVLGSLVAYARECSLEDINKLSSLPPEQAAAVVWESRLINYVVCPALHNYWENTKLNLLYMDLVDEALLKYEERSSRSAVAMDFDLLNNYVRENV